jgi:hypothetical protein
MLQKGLQDTAAKRIAGHDDDTDNAAKCSTYMARWGHRHHALVAMAQAWQP